MLLNSVMGNINTKSENILTIDYTFLFYQPRICNVKHGHQITDVKMEATGNFLIGQPLEQPNANLYAFNMRQMRDVAL